MSICFLVIPPTRTKPSYPHICFFFIYVWCTSDYKLTLRYILCRQLQQRLLFLYFSHHFVHTSTQLVWHHRGTTEPPSFTMLAQPPSYIRGSILSYPLISTSFTHSYECYHLRISFTWFYLTWIHFPRSYIHSLSFTRKRGTHFLSRREHQPT